MSEINERKETRRTSLSRPLLASVSECEEHPDPEVTESKSDVNEASLASPHLSQKTKRFGVKSYLHQFYDENLEKKLKECSEEDAEDEDWSDDEDYHYLISPGRKRRRVCCCFSTSNTPVNLCWKIGLWTGVNLLVLSVVIVLIGFLAPRSIVVVGHNIDLEVIDRDAQRYNYYLDLCRFIGLGLLCCGVAIVAITLLLPSFLRRFAEADFRHNHHEPFKWKLDRKSSKGVLGLPPGPLIPATEELQGIQPKVEPNCPIVVATSTGITVR